jgi:hypothetical protein
MTSILHPLSVERLAANSYRKLKARALEQALAPQRRTPTQAVVAWRVHLLKLLALHVAPSDAEAGTEAPTTAELLQLQRAAEAALRARES